MGASKLYGVPQVTVRRSPFTAGGFGVRSSGFGVWRSLGAGVRQTELTTTLTPNLNPLQPLRPLRPTIGQNLHISHAGVSVACTIEESTG